MTITKTVRFYKPNVTTLRDIKNQIENVLNNGIYTNSNYVRALELFYIDMYNVRYAVACSSCTQGLIMALRVLKKYYNINECAIPSFTWQSTRFAVDMNNMSTKYADVDIDSWLMEDVKSDAYIPVHTFGSVIEYDREPVIYDAAHATGSIIKDFGEMSVFSLSATKIITSCEGGMILTDSSKYYKKLIEIRDILSRMSELNAIIGLDNVSKIDYILQKRKWIYELYNRRLNKYKFQKVVNNTNYSTVAFVVDDESKHSEILHNLELNGIGYKKYYKPLNNNCINSYKIYKSIICLPSYNITSAKDIIKIIENI